MRRHSHVRASSHVRLPICQSVQAAMQAGLDVFAMDSPEHKELKEVERDLHLMEQVSTRAKACFGNAKLGGTHLLLPH